MVELHGGTVRIELRATLDTAEPIYCEAVVGEAAVADRIREAGLHPKVAGDGFHIFECSYASRTDADAIARRWVTEQDPDGRREAFWESFSQRQGPEPFRQLINGISSYLGLQKEGKDVRLLVVGVLDSDCLVPWECLLPEDPFGAYVLYREFQRRRLRSESGWQVESAAAWIGCGATHGTACRARAAVELDDYALWAAGGLSRPGDLLWARSGMALVEPSLHMPKPEDTYLRSLTSACSADLAILMTGTARYARPKRCVLRVGACAETPIDAGRLSDHGSETARKAMAILPLMCMDRQARGDWARLGSDICRFGARLGVTTAVGFDAPRAALVGRAVSTAVQTPNRYSPLDWMIETRDLLTTVNAQPEVDHRQVIFFAIPEGIRDTAMQADFVGFCDRLGESIDLVKKLSHDGDVIDLNPFEGIGRFTTADSDLGGRIGQLQVVLGNRVGKTHKPFNAVILGPSGAGKSFLVQELAAECLGISKGESRYVEELLTRAPSEPWRQAEIFLGRVGTAARSSAGSPVVGFLDEVHVGALARENPVFVLLQNAMEGKGYSLSDQSENKLGGNVVLLYGSSVARTPEGFERFCNDDVPPGGQGPDFFSRIDCWLPLPGVEDDPLEKSVRACSIACAELRLSRVRIEAGALVYIAAAPHLKTTRAIRHLLANACRDNTSGILFTNALITNEQASATEYVAKISQQCGRFAEQLVEVIPRTRGGAAPER